MDDFSTKDEPIDPTFRCPGETYAIDRAVHVARLAAFYPACLACEHRHDTAGLTPRQLRQRSEVLRRAPSGPEWTAEGLFGARAGDVTAEVVARFAAALGTAAWEQHVRGAAPAVLVGCDGSWSTADFVSAACRPLELAGCRAVELGGVTSPALALAAARTGALAALWIGNASGSPHGLALKAWRARGVPASSPGALDAVRKCFEAPLRRPQRRGGSLARWAAEADYLATLAGAYHGLRPLAFVLDTTCEVLVRYWHVLAAEAACRLVPARRTVAPRARDNAPSFVDERLDEIGQQVARERVHFGLWIDGAGETARVVDECGRAIAPEQLFSALAACVRRKRPGAVVVDVSPGGAATSAGIERNGAPPRRTAATAEVMAEEMQATGAALGCDGLGRCWFAGPVAVPDALATLTLLLSLLSETDRPLSDVLDGGAPGE